MNLDPLFTIIMPTYNRADLLSRAIRSVLEQTYQNFELIIINDGSEDHTDKVIKSFYDNRIIYHNNLVNRGCETSRGLGFGLARGKYYGQLDDDDELLPKALETAVIKHSELSQYGIRIIWFNIINAETNEIGGSGLINEGHLSYAEILCGRVKGDYWVTVDTDLIKKNMLFAQQTGYGSLLWLKLLRQTKGYYISQVLYRAYREHGSNRMCGPSFYVYYLDHISSTVQRNQLFMDEYGKELKHLCPMQYGKRLLELGISHILDGNKYRGRRKIRESLRYTRSFKMIVFYLLSFILSEKQMKFLFVTYLKSASI